MERGAAGDDEHLVDLAQDVRVGVQLVQREQTLLVDPADQRVPDRRGLLVDLLQHEVVEPTLLRARHVPRHLEGLDLDLVAVQIRDANVARPHLDHLVLVDRQDGPRLLEHRGDVGREDVLPVAEPDDQRRRDPDAHDDVGFIEREDDERVRPVELADRGPHPIRERTLLLLDQVGDDLGVGVGVKDMAALLETGTQVGEVLDDPVVDHRDTPAAVHVGVRVPVGRRAVGRPPGVPHPDRARDGADDLEGGVELGQLAGPLHHREATVDHRDAGRVVPAVFETSQTLEDDRERLVGAYIAHDAAHEVRG